MASDSPGGYHHLAHFVHGQVVVGGGGGHRDCKDSGYYVSTSDGASTCSSSATEAGDFEGGTLLVLEPKSLRSFTTNDEYLYAMKEDLADWFSCLYQTVITAENFMAMLETGVLLCKHANKMQEFARERREKGETLEMRSYFIRYIHEGNVPYKEAVKPETFQARDNVSNFIKWGRQMGIPEVLSFETDDLVLRKNEKSVILCLLEIARVGAKLGMLAPTLVQMEEEIDAELAGDEPQPRPQIQTCDMRSLDERVRDLIRRCTCPVQFPMVKVGEGKYKIGDSRSLIFVRILRNHVMVRVGGGWDTLENYLNKHDPCQCNYRGHRPSSTTAASQQRKPSTTNYSINRPAPNTPTSPRRSSIQQSNAAAHHDRPSSPQVPAHPSRSKSPTLIISRHVLHGDAKGAKTTAAKAPAEQCSSSSSIREPERSGSPCAPSRLRSPSPGIGSAGSAHAHPGTIRSSPAARPYKQECDVNRFRHPSSSMSSDVDDDEDSYSEELTKYANVSSSCEGRRDNTCGSVSLDDHTEMHTVPKSLLSTLDYVSESGSSSSLDGGGMGARTNVNIDKISTMTLSEFKSLLQSSITVPDVPKPETGRGFEAGQGAAQESLRDKVLSIRDSLSSKASTRRASSCSGRPNGSQTPDEDGVCLPGTNRPKTPQSSRRNVAISRPKTPTSLGTYRPKTPNGSSEKNGQKEEYRMARPKTPSQIKRDAVAKVAGAISNWVESRNEMDSRPKTPTRHRVPLASHSEQWDADSNDEDDSSVASSLSKSQLQALSSAVKERPSTPSRIPKPCFASRPNTPKSVLSDNNVDDCNSSKSFQQSRPSNISISRPQLLSRSSSNASSIRSEDGPSSPSGSQGDEKSLRSSRPTTIISRKLQTPTKSDTAYKDVQNVRRAITPGPGSSLSGLAVTPGPREKWSIGSNGGCDVPDTKRRGSFDVCWSNKSRPHQNQTNSTQDAYFELPITNEITFSDDEEINELVKNAALSAMASNKNRVRSSSVDARKLARRSAKDKKEDYIIIHRDNSGSHGVHVKRDDANVDSKPIVVRRPPSAEPAIRYRALTPDSSKYHQKISASKPSKVASQDCGEKSLNRTEAWVDSTLADPKRKQPPHPKRPKGVVNDIPASELEPRPLEEIKALLSEPTNGFVQVNTEALGAPPEDPELYKKMEKLFEKYREMELRASVNDTPGGSKGDTNSDPNKVSGNKMPKPSPSIASGKTSSGSCASSSGMSSGNPNGFNSSKSSEDNRFKRSSSVPLSLQNTTMTVSHHDEKVGSGGGSEHSLQGSLRDIDSELAKNPTALVSMIKEILKVRPRKDGNSEIPTRIPGPSSLNRNGRSKSVTNLYSNRLSSCDEEALEESLSPSPRLKSDNANTHLEKSNSTSNSNIAYSEFVYSNTQEEVPGLNRTCSARSDSSDGQSRSETPAPKLATPLTTGRSTLLQKRPDKMSRSLSQEKDMYFSNSSACSRSAYFAADDEADFL